MITTKTCNKCKLEKPITEFRFRKSRNEYYSHCKQCQDEYNKQYNVTHKEQQKQRHKTYYESHKQQQKEFKKIYYELNKEYFRELNKKAYELNKKYYINKSKTYYYLNNDKCKTTRRNYYLLNKSKMNNQSKINYQNNKEHYQILNKKYRIEHANELKIKKKAYMQTSIGKLNHSRASQRRRIRKQNCIYDPNVEKYIGYLIKKSVKICIICGERIKKNEPFTIEHNISLVKNGGHTPDNIGLAHKSCNSSKGCKLPNEYAKYKLKIDGHAQTKLL